MKRRKTIVLFALLLLVCSGCSALITRGEVIDKNFSPAHNQIVIVPMVISNGKTTTTVPMPFVYYYPDTWSVTIQKYDNDKNKMQYATYRVTKDVYESVGIGDEFIYKKDMEPNEPEYTREQQ